MKSPMEALVEELVLACRNGQEGSRIVKALEQYARTQRDWERFLQFEPSSYTRNLVARNEWFELLVLCWSNGQESPVHDHAGQDCFMGILQGRMEETHFAFPKPGQSGPLLETRSRIFEQGGVAYIHDSIALHRVRPVGGPAVSLHLYARPIDVCNLYEIPTSRVVSRQMIYHSARGLTGAGSR
jgi:cysteine dioxygenase